jgi:DNA mismatch endonuclease Vsr
MIDHVDASKRAEIMAAVKSEDTSAELALRSLLHRSGYRYRLHDRKLPGRPDVVFPGRKKAIFINGCFWHRHDGCRYATTPKTRIEFWETKFAANVARDHRNMAALEHMGWSVAVVWQCELKQPEKALARVTQFLESK